MLTKAKVLGIYEGILKCLEARVQEAQEAKHGKEKDVRPGRGMGIKIPRMAGQRGMLRSQPFRPLTSKLCKPVEPVLYWFPCATVDGMLSLLPGYSRTTVVRFTSHGRHSGH